MAVRPSAPSSATLSLEPPGLRRPSPGLGRRIRVRIRPAQRLASTISRRLRGAVLRSRLVGVAVLLAAFVMAVPGPVAAAGRPGAADDVTPALRALAPG